MDMVIDLFGDSIGIKGEGDFGVDIETVKGDIIIGAGTDDESDVLIRAAKNIDLTAGVDSTGTGTATNNGGNISIEVKSGSMNTASGGDVGVVTEGDFILKAGGVDDGGIFIQAANDIGLAAGVNVDDGLTDKGGDITLQANEAVPGLTPAGGNVALLPMEMVILQSTLQLFPRAWFKSVFEEKKWIVLCEYL